MNDDGSGARLFDEWAERYDATLQGSENFPFLGYGATLDRLAALASAPIPRRTLDLGIGTGNLALRFAPSGCELWGLDISAKMLALAQAKLPQAHLVQGNAMAAWPESLPARFDRIVSSYVFHHFDLPAKVGLVWRLLLRHTTDGGFVIVGDVSFPTRSEFEKAMRCWSARIDPAEHYWIADEAIAACEDVGIAVECEQTSSCAAVYVFRRRAEATGRRMSADAREVRASGDDLGFSYRAPKGGTVFIQRGGRTVTELRHSAARDFLAAVEDATPDEEQALMARYTGNYKHGNERLANWHLRRR